MPRAEITTPTSRRIADRAASAGLEAVAAAAASNGAVASNAADVRAASTLSRDRGGKHVCMQDGESSVRRTPMADRRLSPAAR